MLAAVLHNEVSSQASADERDVLTQVNAVCDALLRLGHEAEPVACNLNLEATRLRLLELRPRVVFNLVESLGGSDWLAPAAPAMLDALRLPYTGSPTEALFLTTHKLLAKERLLQAGLPTPAWLAAGRSERLGWRESRCEDNSRGARRYIIKSVTEHASVGIDDCAVVTVGNERDLLLQLEGRAAQMGTRCFAEQYIDGREFNLSLLAGPKRPQVLPAAEIDFSGFGPEKPRIVGYLAKWKEDSFEYSHTPRRFDFPSQDRMLLDRLSDLALQCWRQFGLRGYGRVDFRVDAAGRPWILEVNANPCLSPDAGFAAALDRSGISFPQAIQRILGDAVAMDGASTANRPRPTIELNPLPPLGR